MKKNISIVIVLLLLVYLPTLSSAADWPMFRHDLAHTGVAGESVEPPLELLWKYESGSEVTWSSPTVSRSTVYVGYRDGYVYALDAGTGGLKWKYKTGSGVVSSPAVSGGVVYVGSGDNYVYALDAGDGSLKWKYQTGSFVLSSPVVSGGMVYVGSYDDYVYALDAGTGGLKWKYKTGGYVFSSPAVSGGMVYVGSYGYVFALDAGNGSLKWKYESGNEATWSSPAVSGGVVYWGSGDMYVYALDAGDGSLKWKYKTDSGVSSSPAVSGGVVYVGSGDTYVYALDAGDGSLKWKYKTGDNVESSPAVSESVVYVGSWDGYVYAFAPASTPTPTPTTGSISVSSIPSVRIISAPSPIHGGEDVEVTVGWENIPADWKLVVSLEKSDTDKDRLADDVERTISGSGEAVFKLNAYQIDKTYDDAKVWACLRDENDNWASVLTETSITALPAASPAPEIATTLAPTPQITATLAPTSQITATPASTQKPDDGTTQMLILAGSAIIALLVIALIAGKLRGKRRDATFEPPAPRKTKTTPPSGPTIVAEPGQQSPPPEPITKDVTSKTFNEGGGNLPQMKEQLEASGISNLDIKRGFEVLNNKDLRFGIRIKNISRFTINDVDVLLKYDRELFSVKGQEIKHLGNVPNNKEKTAEFILTPLVACVHHSEISAVISYMDASSNSHTDQMHPKEVHCISPFLAEKPMTEGEFSELYENHSCHVKGIVFKGIRPENVTNYMIDSSKSRRYVVKNSLINGTHVIYLSSTAKDKSYYLLTAIIRSENDMTHVGLRVCSNNEGGINNFMNEILTSLRNYINSVQSAREVENVIVNKSIEIINSVVEGGISMEGNASGRDESINIRSER